MILTKTIFNAIVPNCPEKLVDLYLRYINQAMVEFEINTRLRQAAFVAQIAHETGSFRYMREIWGPTAAQQGYEGRADLGNNRLGDGKRFKGRGAIQLTGRANYKKYGELLGLDLESVPELAESSEHCFRIAGGFWKTHGLNELADTGLFKTITKRINGGTNGLPERIDFYEKALEYMQ